MIAPFLNRKRPRRTRNPALLRSRDALRHFRRHHSICPFRITSGEMRKSSRNLPVIIVDHPNDPKTARRPVYPLNRKSKKGNNSCRRIYRPLSSNFPHRCPRGLILVDSLLRRLDREYPSTSRNRQTVYLASINRYSGLKFRRPQRRNKRPGPRLHSR